MCCRPSAWSATAPRLLWRTSTPPNCFSRRAYKAVRTGWAMLPASGVLSRRRGKAIADLTYVRLRSMGRDDTQAGLPLHAGFGCGNVGQNFLWSRDARPSDKLHHCVEALPDCIGRPLVPPDGSTAPHLEQRL